MSCGTPHSTLHTPHSTLQVLHTYCVVRGAGGTSLMKKDALYLSPDLFDGEEDLLDLFFEEGHLFFLQDLLGEEF